jgi:hypothetical protein
MSRNTFTSGYYPENGTNKYYTLTKYNKTSGSGPRYENEWADIVVEWPADDNAGLYIYFFESDSIVRSYCYSPTKVLHPGSSADRLFYINPRYLYDNYRLPMGTDSTTGYKEVNPAIGQAYTEVIPISYDDYNNLPAIMKHVELGKRPSFSYGNIPYHY